MEWTSRFCHDWKRGFERVCRADFIPNILFLTLFIPSANYAEAKILCIMYSCMCTSTRIYRRRLVHTHRHSYTCIFMRPPSEFHQALFYCAARKLIWLFALEMFFKSHIKRSVWSAANCYWCYLSRHVMIFLFFILKGTSVTITSMYLWQRCHGKTIWNPPIKSTYFKKFTDLLRSIVLALGAEANHPLLRSPASIRLRIFDRGNWRKYAFPRIWPWLRITNVANWVWMKEKLLLGGVGPEDGLVSLVTEVADSSLTWVCNDSPRSYWFVVLVIPEYAQFIMPKT